MDGPEKSKPLARSNGRNAARLAEQEARSRILSAAARLESDLLSVKRAATLADRPYAAMAIALAAGFAVGYSPELRARAMDAAVSGVERYLKSKSVFGDGS